MASAFVDAERAKKNRVIKPRDFTNPDEDETLAFTSEIEKVFVEWYDKQVRHDNHVCIYKM